MVMNSVGLVEKGDKINPKWMLLCSLGQFSTAIKMKLFSDIFSTIFAPKLTILHPRMVIIMSSWMIESLTKQCVKIRAVWKNDIFRYLLSLSDFGCLSQKQNTYKRKIVIIYRFIVFKMTKQIIKSQQKKKKMISIWWFSHFKDFGHVFLNFSALFTFFCKVGCMYSFWFFVPSKWNYFLNCFYHFGAWNDLFCSRNGNFDVIFRNCVTNWTSNKPKLIGRVIILIF